MSATLYAFTAFCLLLGYAVCIGVFVIGFRTGRIAERAKQLCKARALLAASPANHADSPILNVNG